MFSSVWIRQPRQRHPSQVGMALQAVPTWVGPAATLPVFLLMALAVFACPVRGQEVRKIPISFLPPPLETATYSLGIYNVKSGKLVRRLQEGATQGAFTIGLNGLITDWDGKDDAGKLVPPGKYAARGYAVGELKVEGERILGNDWTADDENLRVKCIRAILLVPVESLGVLATMADGSAQVFCWSKLAEKMRWVGKPLLSPEKGAEPPEASTYSLLGNSTYLSAHAGNHSALYQIEDGQIFHPDAFSQSIAISRLARNQLLARDRTQLEDRGRRTQSIRLPCMARRLRAAWRQSRMNQVPVAVTASPRHRIVLVSCLEEKRRDGSGYGGCHGWKPRKKTAQPGFHMANILRA